MKIMDFYKKMRTGSLICLLVWLEMSVRVCFEG